MEAPEGACCVVCRVLLTALCVCVYRWCVCWCLLCAFLHRCVLVSVLQASPLQWTAAMAAAQAAFTNNDMVGLVKVIEAVPKTAPAISLSKKDIESNVHNTFAAILTMCLPRARPTRETFSSMGRSDFTLCLSDGLRAVLEFKVLGARPTAGAIDTAVNNALQQIVLKQYRHSQPFVNDGRKPDEVVGYAFIVNSKMQLLGWGKQTGDNGLDIARDNYATTHDVSTTLHFITPSTPLHYSPIHCTALHYAHCSNAGVRDAPLHTLDDTTLLYHYITISTAVNDFIWNYATPCVGFSQMLVYMCAWWCVHQAKKKK